MSELIAVIIIACFAIGAVVVLAYINARSRAIEAAAHRREVGEILNRYLANGRVVDYAIAQAKLNGNGAPPRPMPADDRMETVGV